MATPNVTKISAANLTDGLAALRTHFTSVSTQWEIDSGVTGNGDTGFVIVQQTPSGVGQVSLRRSSTTALQCLMDPTGSITAAGNTSGGPTGADADESSPEYSVTVSASTTQELTVLEWDDEIAILVRTSTSTYSAALVVGRALWQWWDGSPGHYVGNPIANTGNAQVQSAGNQAQNWVAAVSLNLNGSYVTQATVGGIYLTQPEIVGQTTGYRAHGLMRSWSRNYPSQTPTYRYSDGGTPAKEFVYVGTTTGSLVVNWEPGVTP